MITTQAPQEQPVPQQLEQQQQHQRAGVVGAQEDALLHLGADPAVYTNDDTPKAPPQRVLRRAPIDDLVDDGV